MSNLLWFTNLIELGGLSMIFFSNKEYNGSNSLENASFSLATISAVICIMVVAVIN